MEKKQTESSRSTLKNGIIITVLIVGIVVIGVSISYAYYSAWLRGNATVPKNDAAILNIATNLDSVSAIDAPRLSLIDGSDYLNSAEKVTFTVTNESTSNVNAAYTIKLVEMNLSRNLYSKYFKWAIVINAGTENVMTYTGDFADSSIASEGTTVDKENPDIVSNQTKNLFKDGESQSLVIGAMDTVDFYLWLENDESVDQLYLTNGSFSGKLSIDVVPVK